ncbi:hypothetical protein NF556_20600 [Ornithinimicrobium faecis]|uniref:Secreted protein n=1 Tax=Ornithinimicrobium faecis TaxID=2934158 RepID=A0ABY4YTQ5_9MICO|nr:hypothetical protein [Ornithinimicrobium sp. HY1793]USQ79954.1 hypothetical protein NF556_20600 [Ornithinimicrobium sp. HY1793]
MSARTRKISRTALAAVAAPLALGAAVIGPASTAQAHDGAWSSSEWRDTSSCWCELPDEWDGTYFQKDKGGEAAKMRFYTAGDQLAGKVEFHPQGEKVYVYDTLANSDAWYVQVSWTDDNGRSKYAYIDPPSGGNYTYEDLSIPDGHTVTIKIFDDGWGDDHFRTIHGRA